MDHIALVTGADRGLGFALSKGLLERGWHVFAGQYMPEWPELAALASQFPGRLDIVSLDVSSIESARAAAQAVSQRTDHIDLLISNAGIGGGTRSCERASTLGCTHPLGSTASTTSMPWGPSAR